MIIDLPLSRLSTLAVPDFVCVWMQPFYYWGLEEFDYHASRLSFLNR
jgi:hypothetical protein